MAMETARIAKFGRIYRGPTSPHWYSTKDLRTLIQQAPPETTVADVAAWFDIGSQDTRPAHITALICWAQPNS